MNNVSKLLIGVVTLVLASTALADGHGEVMGLKDSKNKQTAKAWVAATYIGLAEFREMLKKHMADRSEAGRYHYSHLESPGAQESRDRQRGELAGRFL